MRKQRNTAALAPLHPSVDWVLSLGSEHSTRVMASFSESELHEPNQRTLCEQRYKSAESVAQGHPLSGRRYFTRFRISWKWTALIKTPGASESVHPPVAKPRVLIAASRAVRSWLIWTALTMTLRVSASEGRQVHRGIRRTPGVHGTDAVEVCRVGCGRVVGVRRRRGRADQDDGSAWGAAIDVVRGRARHRVPGYENQRCARRAGVDSGGSCRRGRGRSGIDGINAWTS